MPKIPTWFERNPKKTLWLAILFVFSLGVVMAEVLVRTIWGLGDPIVYAAHPMYGYRLIANQSVSRFHGSTIKINNLGLRIDSDWDADISNKILFLGDSVTYGGSYISNNELFSSLAVRGLDGYVSGNAGTNGWSIENIHGLIVNAKFLPAKIYVTVIPERDFDRGMSRLGGSPFWCHKPGFGLLELAYYYLSRINNWRYIAWDRNASKDDAAMVMELAVQKLKKMDNFIKSKGYIHMIYISPYRTEVTGTLTRDPAITRYLKQYAVPVTYIVDRIDRESMTLGQKQELFYDDVHLSKKGHILWGKIIGNDLKKLRL